ncbi:MAG: hypothetical protein Q9167_001441 [Letrouitia subvulpina]
MRDMWWMWLMWLPDGGGAAATTAAVIPPVALLPCGFLPLTPHVKTFVSVRASLNMQSPSAAEVPPPKASTICAIVLNHLIHDDSSSAETEAFGNELRTFHRLLDITERERRVKYLRLPWEDQHLDAMHNLVGTCRNTLLKLSELVTGRTAHDIPEGTPNPGDRPQWDPYSLLISTLRAHISFYVRALDMHLKALRLPFSVYQWKSQLPQAGIHQHWPDLSRAVRALKESIAQRRSLTGDSTHHDGTEESILLDEIEKCIKSAEVILSITNTTVYEDGQSPQWNPSNNSTVVDRTRRSPQPRLASPVLRLDSPPIQHQRNGSSTIHTDSDTECDSIFDPEPDAQDGFPPEVYAQIISTLQEDVRREINTKQYQKAENSCRKAIKYLSDRQRDLGIPFDNRHEMEGKLADIYLAQNQLDKARRIYYRLLGEERATGTAESLRKWEYYHTLAAIFMMQNRNAEAEKFAKRAFNGREKNLDKGHPKIIESVKLLIQIYDKIGDHEMAEIFGKVYGVRDPNLRKKKSLPRLPSPPEENPVPQFPSPPTIPSVEERHLATKSRVHWAPDVWVDPSSINAPTKSGETPLISAISSYDDELVKFVLQRGADPDSRDAEKVTPLMHAVRLESEPIIEILLQKGADVDAPVHKWTPLHRAVDLGNVPIMRLLISHSADIEARSPKEYPPPSTSSSASLLRSSASATSTSTHSSDSEHTRGLTPLLRACVLGHLEPARLLLDRGAGIESHDNTSLTPLMTASEATHLPLIDLLLRRGANVHASDDFGWTPLHRALVLGGEASARCAQLLLDNAAEIDARCKHKKTPLHHAIARGDKEMVRFLLDRGAGIDTRDLAERTPLHTAIEERNEAMVRILLENGADTTAMENNGRDALATAKATQRRSPEIIKLLEKKKKEMKRKGSGAEGSVRSDGSGGSGGVKGSLGRVSSGSGSGIWRKNKDSMSIESPMLNKEEKEKEKSGGFFSRKGKGK